MSCKCADCELPIDARNPEAPMLRDRCWAKIARMNELLCDKCMRIRAQACGVEIKPFVPVYPSADVCAVLGKAVEKYGKYGHLKMLSAAVAVMRERSWGPDVIFDDEVFAFLGGLNESSVKRVIEVADSLGDDRNTWANQRKDKRYAIADMVPR
jgi:hypothetical protein